VTDAERRACARAVTETRAVVAAPGLMNPGFEVGNPGGSGPLGWTLASWSPDEGGRTAWVDEAHAGKKAIALTGGEGKVNLVAQAMRRLQGRAGQKVTLTAYYKSADTARPAFSVLGYDAAGKQVQYETSPLPAAPDWRLGSWQVALAEGVTEFTVLLRNSGEGVVLYDEVAVKVG
jgi:hypothetical protein